MEALEKVKKELEEALEKAKKELEEDKKNYWAISYLGEVLCSSKNKDPNYDFKKKTGNYFKTEKEAKEYLEDLKVKAEIKKIAKELNGDKKIDWDDDTQPKHCLIYNYDDSEVGGNQQYTLKIEDTIYCLDEHFADVCIERIGEERLKNYLKKKIKIRGLKNGRR